MITLLPRRFRSHPLWNLIFRSLVFCLSWVAILFTFRDAFIIETNTDSEFAAKQGTNRTNNVTYSLTESTLQTHDQQGIAVPIQRWNATQLVYNLQSYAILNYSIYELLQLVPKPKTNGDDVVQIYNINAWHRLRNLLTEMPGTSTDSRAVPVRLCSVGGSATAGGGGVYAKNVWDEKYVEMLQATGIHSNHPMTSVQVVNRAHGARGSVHAAFVMHSIVPADVDIIIWEFAINDGYMKGCQEVNNGIIIWLNQIQRMWSQKPPLVLLAYLWDAGVARSADRTISDTVFQCHGHLAATYDFVVGSVNLGSYVRHLPLDYDSLGLLVADDHHPNEWGHWLLAYLLWDLTTDTTRTPIKQNNIRYDYNGTTPQPNLTCNNVPSMKKRVNKLLDRKYAFASWTAEVPRNEEEGDLNQGMLIPYLYNIQNATTIHRNLSYVDWGKSSDWRMDRKRAAVLPCCSTPERLFFDVTTNPDQWASAVHVYAPDVTTVQGLSRSIWVGFLNTNGTSALGNRQKSLLKWVTYESNECRVGHWFLNTWLVLREPQQGIAQLVLCNRRPKCGKENSPPVTIMHVVLY